MKARTAAAQTVLALWAMTVESPALNVFWMVRSYFNDIYTRQKNIKAMIGINLTLHRVKTQEHKY